MHNGKTLDKIIQEISVDENGESSYSSTDDFTNKFILGELAEQDGQPVFQCDSESAEFVADFLNYMAGIEKRLPEGARPNGSILFSFDEYFDSPLDPTQKSSSLYYQIAKANTLVPSTVSNNRTVIGAGKSIYDPIEAADSIEKAENPVNDFDALPMAAKTAVAATTGSANSANQSVAEHDVAATKAPAATEVKQPAAADEEKPAATAEPATPANPNAADAKGAEGQETTAEQPKTEASNAESASTEPATSEPAPVESTDAAPATEPAASQAEAE